MDRLTAVVLAAGEGKRMRSRQPKVLHPLCGRALIAYPLRAARTLADRIVLVVGPNADDVVELAGPDVRAVVQRERLGSGHAVSGPGPNASTAPSSSCRATCRFCPSRPSSVSS